VTDTLTDKVIGSGTVLLNIANQRAYVRGVMIDPTYQGYGLGGYILVNAFREIIKDYRDSVKIFWTESRTAHNKSQKIAEASGLRPVGLLPNKDIFLEKRESDLLMVLYSMNTLKNRRPNPQLIPEVMPIYNVIGQQFRLESVEPVTDICHINANGYQVRAFIVTDKYDYCYCTFQANGQDLKFMINPRVQVAEQLWFSPGMDPKTLKTLLQSALQALYPHIFYMESYVSAFQPAIQQVFVDLGFQPTGYIPGWDLINGQREDAIIMTRVKELPSLSSVICTKRSEKITQIFLK
jgi:hypothetical protein